MKTRNLEKIRVHQSTFRPEIPTGVSSKFTCCSQALKFGTVLSKTFGSLRLHKSWIPTSTILLDL